LRKENDVEVEVVKGGLLELSVKVDGEKVVETNRLWYPLPGSLVKRTREFLTRSDLTDLNTLSQATLVAPGKPISDEDALPPLTRHRSKR
jgi:hypothetical protein